MSKLRGLPHRLACVWTANCPIRSAIVTRPRDCRYRRGARGWGFPSCRSAHASAFRGWGTPAAAVPIASPIRKPLRDNPLFTGYTRDGGFATHVVADAAFTFPSPASTIRSPQPLMCAGLIGWRSLRGRRWAPNRPVWLRCRRPHPRPGLPLARPRRLRLHRSGDAPAQGLALSLGARWAGGSDETPLNRWMPPSSSRQSERSFRTRFRRSQGGRVVCGGIHMSDIPQFPYSLLWEERHVYPSRI